MQRPSVYVGTPETSSSFLSKPSPRHTPAATYAVSEIVEEEQDNGHLRSTPRRAPWSLKPEETVHLIPAILFVCSLILSLPTCYNAYQGLPLSTTYRFGGSSAKQMQMSSGDAILIHPDLKSGVEALTNQKDWVDTKPEELVALQNVKDELKRRRVRSAGLGDVLDSAKGDTKSKGGDESVAEKGDGGEPKKVESSKKEKNKSGRREKKKGKGGGKKKGDAKDGKDKTSKS